MFQKGRELQDKKKKKSSFIFKFQGYRHLYALNFSFPLKNLMYFVCKSLFLYLITSYILDGEKVLIFGMGHDFYYL